jgi:hypothetical protein
MKQLGDSVQLKKSYAPSGFEDVRFKIKSIDRSFSKSNPIFIIEHKGKEYQVKRNQTMKF